MRAAQQRGDEERDAQQHDAGRAELDVMARLGDAEAPDRRMQDRQAEQQRLDEASDVGPRAGHVRARDRQPRPRDIGDEESAAAAADRNHSAAGRPRGASSMRTIIETRKMSTTT